MMNSKNQKTLIKQFEGKDIDIILDENNEPLFELYGVGMALGYMRTNGYARKDRIDKCVKNGLIEPFVHGGQKYLSEEMIYDFMFEAKTDKCREFRKWLSTDVLPSIRKFGVYQDREDIDKDYLKYNYKALNN